MENNRKERKRSIMITNVLLLILIAPLAVKVNSQEAMNTTAAQHAAIEAVKKKFNWTQKHLLTANIKRNPYFKKVKIFRVTVNDSTAPPPIFTVATDEDLNTFVFSFYEGIKDFSEIVAMENITINKETLNDFIDSFAFIFRWNMSRANSVEEIRREIHDKDLKTRMIMKWGKIIKPTTMNIIEDQYTIEFFLWHSFGNLEKFILITTPYGKILSCRIERYEIGKSKPVIDKIE
jgi:hypothetical protein